MSDPSAPFAWDPHLLAWSVLVAGGVLVVGVHRHLQRSEDPPIPWTRKEIGCFAAAWFAAAVASTWPVADLSAHWSLTALVTQRVILVVAVAPLLLYGLPYDVLRRVTKPAPIDAVVTRCQRPLVAIAVVTGVLGASMTPALVAAQASSTLSRGAIDLAVVLAGIVLWIPVIGRIPGVVRPRPVVRFAYLVVQAVVPAFLSFVFILSTRPLYPAFAHSQEAIGLRALNDQQVAGFVSKLSMLFVLLTVGAVVLARAPVSDEEAELSEPLVWADVERQFERMDRRAERPR